MTTSSSRLPRRSCWPGSRDFCATPGGGRRRCGCSIAEADPDNRTVTQNGRAVELTPREFTLLLVLVRARGQALYRDILYERVWGPDAEPNPRALDLHIHRLRKKRDWADKIVTVPKVGYKLLAER